MKRVRAWKEVKREGGSISGWKERGRGREEIWGEEREVS